MLNNTPLIVFLEHFLDEVDGKHLCLNLMYGPNEDLSLCSNQAGQFMYPSSISTFRERSSCKAFWEVTEVAGFGKYPSKHGRTGSWKLEVQGWNVPSIPITFPEEHKDSRHRSSTCKTTRSPSISRQLLFPSVVKVFFDSLHGKNHIHVLNFPNYLT